MDANETLLMGHIDDWIMAHADELVEDVKKLVRIRSVNDVDSDVKPYGQACRDVLDLGAAIYAGYGFDVKNHGYRCCTATLHGETEDRIGIFNHLDVVPEGNDWSFPPYEPFVKDGYIAGRGSSDNKGPAVAALYAVRCLHSLGVKLKHSVMMYLGAAEEVGMDDIKYYLNSNPAPKFSITPDAMFSVCHGEKGILRAQFTRDIAGGNLISFEGGQITNSVADRAKAVITGFSQAEVQKALAGYERITVQENCIGEVGDSSNNGRNADTGAAGGSIADTGAAGGSIADAGAAGGSSNSSTVGGSIADPGAADDSSNSGEVGGSIADAGAAGVVITAVGVARHAAFPDGSVNAIQLLAQALSEQGLLTGPAQEAMQFIGMALADNWGAGLDIAFEDDVSGATSCIGGLAWMDGTVFHQDINVRYAIKTDITELKRKLTAKINENGFSLTLFDNSSPCYTPIDNPIIQMLDKTVAEFYGDSYKPYIMGGGTYARMIPNTVGYGPEDVDSDGSSQFKGGHQPDEGMSIEVLLTAAKIYSLAIMRLDKML